MILKSLFLPGLGSKLLGIVHGWDSPPSLRHRFSQTAYSPLLCESWKKHKERALNVSLCVKGETSFPIFLRHVFLRRSRKVALCASVGVSYFLVREFAFFG